jgi:hypothetical protein
MNVRIKSPRSLREKQAWFYLAVLQILFIALFAFHMHVTPGYGFEYIFEYIPDDRWWIPLRVILGLIATYFVWGLWMGVFVLLIEIWLFRKFPLPNLWALVAISCAVISAEAGIYNTFVSFELVTILRVVEGGFTFLLAFGLPLLIVLAMLTLYRLGRRHGLIKPSTQGG